MAESNMPSRRHRVLQTAGRLFARWGYDKTSMDDIAREAGISKGAVYLEFPNKGALFKAVLHEEFADYSRDWLRRFERDPGEWSFASMFQHSIVAMNANPFVKAVMTQDQQFLGNALFAERDLMKQAVAARTVLFAQLQEVGAMRDDITPATLAYLISCLGYGLIAGREVIPVESRVPFEEGLQAFALLLDRGLAPPRFKNRKAARQLIITMTDKMQAALREASLPATDSREGAS